MKRVCIINPPYNPLTISEDYIEHIGIAYLVSFLENRAISVDIIDCPYQNINSEILQTKIVGKYDVIGFSTYFYNYLSVKRIIRKIKKENKKTFIFLGGYLPTLNPKRILSDCEYVDCLIMGEGEITTYELLVKLNNDQDWHFIDGIAFFLNKKININAPRKLIANLDVIPFPKRIDRNRNIYTVISSRGCYGHCNFCGINEFYQKNAEYVVRKRTVQNVIEELRELLVRCPNIKEIRFNDDNFAISSSENKKWIEKFVRELIENKINLQYSCLIRANDVCNSVESLRILKSIGLKMVFIGIESFVQEDLDFYNKKVEVIDNINALKICDELNIRYQIGFMMFNPESTLQSIIKNINCFKEIKFNQKYKYYSKPISNSVVIVTEGSPLEKYVVKEKLNCANSIGYKFRDKKVEKCFELINIWYGYIERLGRFYELEEYYEKKNETEALVRVREILYELFFYDLEVLYKIVISVQKCEEIEKIIHDMDDDIAYVDKIYSKLAEEESINGVE